MGLSNVLGKRFSCRGSEREPDAAEQLFVVKRFAKKGRSPCLQRGRTNQRILLPSKDDGTRGRRNRTKLGLNFQTAHLRHANINQGNRRAMSPRVSQKLLGVAKEFCTQIG